MHLVQQIHDLDIFYQSGKKREKNCGQVRLVISKGLRKTTKTVPHGMCGLFISLFENIQNKIKMVNLDIWKRMIIIFLTYYIARSSKQTLKKLTNQIA